MKKKTINLTSYTLFMLLVPAYFEYRAYTWTLVENLHHLPEIKYWIELINTVSMPYCLLTSLVLLFILFMLTRQSYPYKTVLWICLLSMVGTQTIEPIIKNILEKPSPYITEIHDHHPTLLKYNGQIRPFDAHPTTTQYQIIDKLTQNNPLLAENFKNHLNHPFAFDHNIFALSWLLLFVGFLWRKIAKIMVLPILLIWAGAILYAHVRLGICSSSDLIVVILIAWLWHLFLFINLLPKLKRKF